MTDRSTHDRESPSLGLPGDLRRALGDGSVKIDAGTLRLFSVDVYRAGCLPLAVVRPRNTREVATVVTLAAKADCAVYVRGGGMSYTDAYLPDREASVILDTGALTDVREINPGDLYATVGAGVTWRALDELLAPHGVRSVFWGPMSGKLATIGGAMSQGAATFGSGRHGLSAVAALGFEIVTGGGDILETGCAGQPGHLDFFRHYGPDLTGLFTGDAGALGIKTAVSLQLEPRPDFSDGLSFAFDRFDGLVSAVGRIARDGLATEVFGAETALARMVADASTFRTDLKTLWAVGQAARNPVAGVNRMLRIAAAGRRFLNDSKYTISFLAEGRNARALRSDLAGIRRAVGRDGYEIPNTMATVTRATPFPDPMVLGPGGRCLLPLHGVVQYSRVEALHEAVAQFLEQQRPEYSKHDIDVFLVYSTLARSGFLYELVIYWPDEWNELHRETLPAEILGYFSEGEPRTETREIVDRLKSGLVEIMYQHGCAHMQIGRMYPYTRDRNSIALDLLRRARRELDPGGLINPGALGL